MARNDGRRVGGQNVYRVDNFKYLFEVMRENWGIAERVTSRIKCSWMKWMEARGSCATKMSH